MLKALFLAATCLLAFSIKAEPNATTTYLMNETVSLLDFGAYQLGQDLTKWLLGVQLSAKVSVQISKQLDRLEIDVTSEFPAPSKAKARSNCMQAIHSIKIGLNVDPSTGERLKKDGLRAWFSHFGYTHVGEPKDLTDKLDQITVLKAEFAWGNTDFGTIKCQSNLRSGSIMFEE